jgi:hypothetical protein
VGRGLRDRGDAGEAAAVVAGGAARNDAGVIHRRVGPIRRAFVACRARLRSRNVVRGHSTSGTGESQRAPVTGFAGRPGGDVVCRLAKSLRAVMAGCTSRCNAGMIEGCAREACEI